MASARGETSSPKTSVRPLLFRAGARYTCFGDGLCCHDIHGLGPITKRELVQIRRLDRRGAGWDEGFEDHMLSTAADGACHFLLPNLLCDVHARFGPEAKPEGCRRFPLGLTATPEGGRVTTFHRCTCRTLGDRPELTEQDVLPALQDRRGRPKADRRVKKVQLRRKGKRVAFAEWRALEAPLLEALQTGVAPEPLLGAEPFPRLTKLHWEAFAEDLLDERDATAFGVAAAFFAEAVRLCLAPAERSRWPRRPWADSYARAEARSPDARAPNAMLADWVADEIWSLSWAEVTSFDVKRAELATRLALARRIYEGIEAKGTRPDRAMAEAIMIVELIGESEHWTDLLPRMRPPKEAEADGTKAKKAKKAKKAAAKKSAAKKSASKKAREPGSETSGAKTSSPKKKSSRKKKRRKADGGQPASVA
ncbi:MAG: hypothetical protein AAF447_13010 [Myxococcota bacterium]